MPGQQPEAAEPTTTDGPCPIDLTASVLCQKWTALIIRDLRDGPCYFKQLEYSVSGITPRMLCNRLDSLREHGIVERREIRGLPPRVEYSLTERGHALIRVVEEMDRFGRRWLAGLD